MVIFDDEESFEIEDENACFGCGGTDELENAAAWIGCSSCSKWFHKSCVSSSVVNMNEEELHLFNYYCKTCDKNQSKN